MKSWRLTNGTIYAMLFQIESKAMMGISTQCWRYREKMVGANLHKDLPKLSRSCEPNGYSLSRLQRTPTVTGESV